MSTITEPRSPKRPAWAIGTYCELVRTTPTRSVRISARAAQVIEDEVRGFYQRELYGMDGETGGACMGRRQVPGRDIEITEAGIPGSDTKTGRGWLRLGGESWLRLHQEHAPCGLVENATYHSHPIGYAATPSHADLRAWHTNLRAARNRYGSQVNEFIGLIVTPNSRGATPTIHAWIVTQRDSTYATAEPALVAIGSTAAQNTPTSGGRKRVTLEPAYGGVCTSERISEYTFQRSNGIQVIEQPMAVATRSFTAMYDGKPVHIRAGISRVATSHELARAHADAWKPLPGGAPLETSG